MPSLWLDEPISFAVAARAAPAVRKGPWARAGHGGRGIGGHHPRPGHFIFYEIFATPADFEAHNRTPHVQAWFARLPELADGPVKAMRMQILGNRP